jgi:diguanylate cyclase (GGDEF)-like protein
MAGLLMLGSAASSFYIVDVTQKNARALQLRDTVTKSVNRIRQANQQANTTLGAMIVSPQPHYPQNISRSLKQAMDEIQSLQNTLKNDTPKAREIIEDLYNDTHKLQNEINSLIEKIKDPNWVYPMLPYINNTLLESNTEFESAATLALQEIAEEEGENYSSSLYREIAQIRDLWRLQILDFRAVIVRFAGLNRIERIPQEQNIDFLNKEIRSKIKKLRNSPEKDSQGFETIDSLEIMNYRAQKWYEDYKKLQKIRNSKIWRADVHFTETIIKPLQIDTREDLENLEQAMLNWSSKNTAAVESAALKTNLELWGMTAAAVLFVSLIYFMISRSVLRPINKIATTITEEGKHIEHISIPSKSSHEIYTLMTAFNTMRRQIHHRQMALEYQALHDSLTSLPNRALLQDRLEQSIQQAKRRNNNIAFMLLDLDRFKNINDTLGHAIGDQVLQEISQRLINCLRTSDTVARLGGDEFAIISPDIDSTQIRPFIEKVIREIEQPITINKQNMHVGVSIGISLFPENGDNADSLMRQADIAMYDAKHNKKDYSFFTSQMEELNANSLSLLGELKEEIRQPTENLFLHYQPQIDIHSNKIFSVETLLRWKHPKNGMLPPDEIIRLCEQSGLITELTHWVLEKAIKTCSNWAKDDLELNISVNLSAWNLQDNELPAYIMQLLRQHDLPANKLTLEITESAVMNDPTRARETLTALSKMGIRLDIDDYGTGFSSLAYLKMLPVSGLKIDKSFVIDMQEDENDNIIVQSTIDLAHNLHLIVIAEGVESEAALTSLKEYNCNYAQGYHIAKPMSDTDLREWCLNSDYSA